MEIIYLFVFCFGFVFCIPVLVSFEKGGGKVYVLAAVRTGAMKRVRRVAERVGE